MAKGLTCRAILTTHAGGPKASQAGQRCPEAATEPKGLPQLCWVHQQALANRHRVRPLELVPMTIAERDKLEAHQ